MGEGVGAGGEARVRPGELFGETGGGPPVLKRGGHLCDAGGDGVVREQRSGGRVGLGIPYVRPGERFREEDVGEGRPAHEVRPAHAVGQGRAVEGGEPAADVLGVGEVGAAAPQEGGVPAVPGEVAGVVHGALEVGTGLRDHGDDLLAASAVEARGERPEHGRIGAELPWRRVHERRQVLHEELPHQPGRRLGDPRPPVRPAQGEQSEHRFGGACEDGVAALGRSVEEAVEPGVGQNGLGHASQGSSGEGIPGIRDTPGECRTRWPVSAPPPRGVPRSRPRCRRGVGRGG